ncbi:unnamed protein product [Lampetra fluviatilis]
MGEQHAPHGEAEPGIHTPVLAQCSGKVFLRPLRLLATSQRTLKPFPRWLLGRYQTPWDAAVFPPDAGAQLDGFTKLPSSCQCCTGERGGTALSAVVLIDGYGSCLPARPPTRGPRVHSFFVSHTAYLFSRRGIELGLSALQQPVPNVHTQT